MFPDAIQQAMGLSGMTAVVMPGSGLEAPTRTWSGPRSGILFQSRQHGAGRILAVRLESEIPVVTYFSFLDEKQAEQYAVLFDLGCALSRSADTLEDFEISRNALGLAFVRDQFRSNAVQIRKASDDILARVPPGKDRDRLIENHAASARRVERIADRIDEALKIRLKGKIYPAATPSPEVRIQH